MNTKTDKMLGPMEYLLENNLCVQMVAAGIKPVRKVKIILLKMVWEK